MRSTRFKSRCSSDGDFRCSERDLVSAHECVRNSTSARTSSGGALAAAVRTMKPPPARAFRVVHQMPKPGALFGGSNLARNAGVIERRHVHQVAARQRDVAGDARAFLAERFLGDLHDNFLALLEHVRNQLRAARRGAVMAVAMTAVPVLRAAAAIVATAAIAISAALASPPRGMLHSRTEIALDARTGRLRFLRGRLAGILFAALPGNIF